MSDKTKQTGTRSDTGESTVPLEVENVSKNYGSIEALKNVSFDLKSNEVLGIVGDNGAGKSTMIQILRGALQPTRGNIYVNGEQKRFHSPQDAIASGIECVYQESATVDELTVAENFFVGREPTRYRFFVNFRQMKRETESQLAEMGFQFDTGKKVKDLSGGERRAVSILRALYFDPRILLLDEPFTALSEKAREKVTGLLRKVKEHCSMIFVTHYFEDALRICDRLVILRHGEVSFRTDTVEGVDREQMMEHI